MQGAILRKYGVQTTINFELYQTDGINLKSDAAYAAGDIKIMKDEGDEANTTNGFTDEGQGYSLVLTATEMQAARIVLYVVDQGTKVWLDKVFRVETYGNASAQHAFDLATATQSVSIGTGGIVAGSFAAGAIDATAVADNAIDSGAIATGAITSAKFAAGAINAAAIADAAIDIATFAADCKTGSYINCQVKGQDNIDFGALQKTSLNAATPASVVGAVGSVTATVSANIIQIDGNATNGNNATLNLKKLNIVNDAGDAIVAQSTGSNGNGINASGNGSGHGSMFTGGATGNGFRMEGGSSSGAAMYCNGSHGAGIDSRGGNGCAINGTSTNNSGMRLQAGNGWHGFESTGAGSGNGMALAGGGSGGDGLKSTGSNYGIEANIQGNISGSIGSLGTTAKSDVNAEIVDALNTDTYSEPAAGAPPDSPTIRQMAHYVFQDVSKAKKELNGSTGIEKIYKNNGTDERSKRTVTDDGTTTTKTAAVAP